ncbi:MAG: hypothetical protein HC886_08240 [Leptolyngbyaceae cyanobacterium SM1_1_3]|nr:hypothetical protein [Leptolyngbyaceae cyanobacterium SM1_1_3]NJN04154.1 hypothetical protein [Leptolyngbyaceae cyanobacterium RM1_1_2]NJO11846.1 hypothetical protein [Leptolyngbyaceae cyanobacterium SL_1_1]
MTTPITEIISNLEYDWLTVLQSKTESLQAYDKYIRDAEEANSQPCVEMLKKLRAAESKQVQEIRQHLISVMQNGSM